MRAQHQETCSSSLEISPLHCGPHECPDGSTQPPCTSVWGRVAGRAETSTALPASTAMRPSSPCSTCSSSAHSLQQGGQSCWPHCGVFGHWTSCCSHQAVPGSRTKSIFYLDSLRLLPASRSHAQLLRTECKKHSSYFFRCCACVYSLAFFNILLSLLSISLSFPSPTLPYCQAFQCPPLDVKNCTCWWPFLSILVNKLIDLWLHPVNLFSGTPNAAKPGCSFKRNDQCRIFEHIKGIL